jgi:hypothetical protein
MADKRMQLEQSAEQVADQVKLCLKGDDRYRTYICEECIDGMVFWEMDDDEVDKFEDLERKAPIKRGHAVSIKILKNGARGSGNPPSNPHSDKGLAPPVHGDAIEHMELESTSERSGQLLIKRKTHDFGEPANEDKSTKTKSSATKRSKRSSGPEDDTDQRVTSKILYATPLQSNKFEEEIGKAGVRTLQSNFHTLRALVDDELEALEQGRLASLNFKKNDADKAWRKSIYQRTMEETEGGRFTGSNGVNYKWPESKCISNSQGPS